MRDTPGMSTGYRFPLTPGGHVGKLEARDANSARCKQGGDLLHELARHGGAGTVGKNQMCSGGFDTGDEKLRGVLIVITRGHFLTLGQCSVRFAGIPANKIPDDAGIRRCKSHFRPRIS